MAKNISPSSDFIHKFTLVRPFVKYNEESLSRRFIFLEKTLTEAEKANLNNADNTLLFFYKKDNQEKIKNALQLLKNSNSLLSSLKQLFTEYPNFNPVYRAFYESKESYNLKKLNADIKNALTGFNKKNLIAFNSKIRLWDNMLLYYFNSTLNPEVREEILQIIRMIWIMERMDKEDLADINIREAFEATIVLPEKDEIKVADNPVSQNNEDKKNEEEKRRKELDDRLKILTTAVKEINTEHENQTLRNTLDDGCKEVKTKIDPSILTGRYLGNLSEGTHQILDELKVPKDVFHVPTAINRITSQLKQIIPSSGSQQGSAQLMKLGSSMVKLSDFVSTVPFMGGLKSIAAKAPFMGGGIGGGVGSAFGPGQTTIDQVNSGIKFGMADLKVVETKLLKYDKGEIAHIENILAGETKDRILKVLNRVEDTFMTDEEITTINQNDSQSTDRFEISQEISKQEKEDMKVEAGLKVTADLGSVDIAANADFAYSSSKENSDKVASKQSRETINKALVSVTERRRTQRTTKTIKQTEEINEHKITNPSTKDHITGVYRWVNKYYLAELKNYGLRWMIEFIIPEPAAFYIHSKAKKKTEGFTLVKPEFPRIWMPTDTINETDEYGYRPILTYHDIFTEDEHLYESYDKLAAKYGATVTSPPAKTKLIAKSFSSPSPAQGAADGANMKGRTYVFTFANEEKLTIPEGYVGTKGIFNFSYDGLSVGDNTDVNRIEKLVEGFIGWIPVTNTTPFNFQTFGDGSVGHLSGEVPFSLHVHGYEFAGTIEITCELTLEKMNEWRKTTYKAIMDAYDAKLAAYNQEMKDREAEAKLEINIQGNNPDRNREIEKEELKKSSIEMLTGQRYESFDAMRYAPAVSGVAPYYGYPDFSFSDAKEEGRFIQFFEQVFDWHLMTYKFYPYFWADKSRWTLLNNIQDTDPIFRSFLQAGAARVLVPIKVGEEHKKMFTHYLNTGKLWNGGDAPIPGDPMWISIADEFKNETDDKGTVVDQWIVKLPTDLIILDKLGDPLPNNVKELDDEIFVDEVRKELGI